MGNVSSEHQNEYLERCQLLVRENPQPFLRSQSRMNGNKEPKTAMVHISENTSIQHWPDVPGTRKTSSHFGTHS